jgi:hypothetical protein
MILKVMTGESGEVTDVLVSGVTGFSKDVRVVWCRSLKQPTGNMYRLKEKGGRSEGYIHICTRMWCSDGYSPPCWLQSVLLQRWF